MLRTFIISIIVLLSNLSLRMYGQGISDDSLMLYEHAYFKTTNDTAKQNILLKKINYYLKNDHTGPEVFNELKRVERSFISDSNTRIHLLWNAIIIAYLNNETDHAGFYLEEYNAGSKDTSAAFGLLSVLVNRYKDTNAVNNKLKQLVHTDSLFKNLVCFGSLVNYNRKHLGLYLFSSAILPGWGTIMNGYPVKGLISLALTAASAYAIVKLVQYGLYVNAVLWGTGAGLKLYAGNIKLTEQSFYKAEERQKNKLTNDCELKLNKVLEKYPITLKAL